MNNIYAHLIKIQTPIYRAATGESVMCIYGVRNKKRPLTSRVNSIVLKFLVDVNMTITDRRQIVGRRG